MDGQSSERGICIFMWPNHSLPLPFPSPTNLFFFFFLRFLIHYFLFSPRIWSYGQADLQSSRSTSYWHSLISAHFRGMSGGATRPCGQAEPGSDQEEDSRAREDHRQGSFAILKQVLNKNLNNWCIRSWCKNEGLLQGSHLLFLNSILRYIFY